MISSAASLFYGRRSRHTRNFDDDLQLDPNSNPRHRNNNHRLRRHYRHNHNPDDTDRSLQPFTVVHPFNPSLLIHASDLPQGCISESPTHSILNREATHSLSRRHDGGSRLPGSVLLARERLLQRLRGGFPSEVRENVETSASAHHNDTMLTELSIGESHQSMPQGSSKRSQGLTADIISQLNHESFIEFPKGVDNSISKTSKDCSICLDNFVEGNELISLHCGHRFHAKCLYPWLQCCGECPYCRSRIQTA